VKRPVKLEILGAILAMIAPFVFHWLLQTRLRMRDIALIMLGIALLSVVPAIHLIAPNNFVQHIPPSLLVKSTLVLAVIILAVWQYIQWRNVRPNRRNKNP
jgi:uncharacterized membrane protein YidH (DUF202 family)